MNSKRGSIDFANLQSTHEAEHDAALAEAAAAIEHLQARVRELEESAKVTMVMRLRNQYDEQVKRAEQAEARLAAESMERRCYMARFDAAIQHLMKIHSFIQPQNVVLPDGRQFKFAPPDAFVREAWEALSAAIYEIPEAIDAAQRKEST